MRDFQLPRLKAFEARTRQGRATENQVIVRATANGPWYLAKPWHNADGAYNLHNQLRPAIVTACASHLGFEAVCRVVVFEAGFSASSSRGSVPERVEHAVLGMEFHENATTLGSAAQVGEQVKNIANPADIARVVFLDLWLLNSDRKPGNPNLIVAGGRLFMIDLDNFFTGAETYSKAKEARSEFLRDHPLAPWLRIVPGVTAVLEQAAKLAAEVDTDRLRRMLPPDWFKEGGGPAALSMIDSAKSDALAVARSVIGAAS